MTRFRFRLDRLLDLRSKAERERERALGLALREQAERQRELDETQSRLDVAQQQAADEQRRIHPAGALHNLGLTLAAAAHERDAAATMREQAGQVVDGERDRLEVAQRDRRVVERMREQRLEAWTAETGRTEQQEIDGLALDRHRRQQEDRT